MKDMDLLREMLTSSAMTPETPRGQAAPVPPEKPVPPDATLISLPEPGLLPDIQVNFLEMVELRASIRIYRDKAVSLKDLSFLLWCTQGVKMAMPSGVTMRNVPSAGACHAFSTYLLLQRIEGLTPGLYRFLPLEHALYPVRTGAEVVTSFLPAFPATAMVEKCAAVFLWCADFSRMSGKYGARSLRYLFLDAGHICQNLYLAAQALRIGVCAVGAFYDQALNNALALDGENDFVAYAATIGWPET